MKRCSENAVEIRLFCTPFIYRDMSSVLCRDGVVPSLLGRDGDHIDVIVAAAIERRLAESLYLR